MSLYRNEEIGVAGVERCSQAPTGVGFIVVEDGTGQNCIVLDPGANELLTAKDVLESRATLESARVVLTQLEISAEAAAAALTTGRRAGAITILNPAPVRPLPASMLELTDILTPNETEARVLAGHKPDDKIEAQAVAEELIRSGVRQVVMTLGENGALLVTASSCKQFPAVRVPVSDTTGAGDAFNAGLATALAHQASLEEAVGFGVMIGGMAVMKENVIPSLPTRDDVRRFCGQRAITPPEWLAP
jgi:ribokinase